MTTIPLLKMISDFEGRIPHMYADTRGNVTVGVGHLIPDMDSAIRLPFVVRGSWTMALPISVSSDFNAVRQQPAGKSASYYRTCTVCDLTDAGIDDLLLVDLSGIQLGLAKEFPSWDSFPESVQNALTDLGFNLGVHGLQTKFPRLWAAIRTEDWRTCAAESHREDVSSLRNDTVRSLFVSAVPTGDIDVNLSTP